MTMKSNQPKADSMTKVKQTILNSVPCSNCGSMCHGTLDCNVIATPEQAIQQAKQLIEECKPQPKHFGAYAGTDEVQESDYESVDLDKVCTDTIPSVECWIQDQTDLIGQWEEINLTCPTCKSNANVFVFHDNKTCYCIACSIEFDTVEALENVEYENGGTGYLSDEFAAANKAAAQQIAGNPEKPINQTPTTSTVTKSYSYKPFCFHQAQQVIRGKNGRWGVWLGKKDDVKHSAHNYDVVLNLTFGSIKQSHDIPIRELQKWESFHCNYKEICLDWPDYGIVALPRQFWLDLLKYITENNYKLLIFCQGGHGRTGTAAAILLCLACGYTPQEAKDFIWSKYCRDAIESNSQEQYIDFICKQEKEAKEKEQEKSKAIGQAN